MQIIHIVLGKANPERMNGVNKVVYQLATKQAAAGINVCVWGITANTEINYGERNFSTKLFPLGKGKFGLSKELKKALLLQSKDCLFHIHGGWIPAFYSISMLLKSAGLHFVFTPHGAYNTIAMQRNYWLKRLYFFFFEKRMLQHAHRIHCIGKSEVSGLGCIFKTRKAVLIPYGYEMIEQETQAQTNTNSGIVFGFIGRLDIYTKGLDTLIDAFKLFAQRNEDSTLWIVGDSKEKAVLSKKIAELGLQEKIILHGSHFGASKTALLQGMDVFVHPSRNEGLPTSVIEAASFGKPCIVTEATNIGDLIEDYYAGINIQEQSAEQLAAAMQEMYNIWNSPEEYLAMQNRAQKMVAETYEWNKIVAAFNNKLYSVHEL